MRVRRTLATLLAMVVSAPCLLSACGGGSTSVADPPVSSAPTSSAPTTRPPAHESPEHFIRQWAAEDTRIQSTGDTTRFREMSQGCRGCIKLADLVDRIYKAGGFIHTRGWRIRSISAVGSHRYDLFVFSTATSYASAKGGTIHHLPSGPAHFQVELKAAKHSWHVTALAQIAS